jgi:FkbH-like protein
MTETMPADFTALYHDLVRNAPDLASIHLVGEQLAQLATQAKAQGGKVQKIAVLSSLTADFLVKAIACGVAAEGVLADFYLAPFGSYLQQVFDRGSALHHYKPDLVVIAPDARELVENYPINTPDDAVAQDRAAKVGQFEAMWSILGQELGAKVVQLTLIPPHRRLRGLADRLLPHSPQRQIDALNTDLIDAGRGRVNWVEMDRLASKLGDARFADESGYINARLPFALKYLPDIIPPFRAAWRLSQARAKKVLVVDLDNTMWGGVIGDDGVEGIVLGPGTPRGEAFLSWNLYIKQLSERGVILAVCSKNNADIAATGFDHPSAIFARKDFAAFHCAWTDKANGLRQIAKELNVGVDSFVFVDDNPAECEQVRGELPEVAVIHLGTDPTRFIEKLDLGQWFDLDQYTAEDAGRAAAYAARAAASQEAANAGDLSSYLAGLSMQGRFARADDKDLPRVAQLEYKTNQFNLTTRRYSDTDIAQFAAREDAEIFTFRLRDKFGDHGLVSSVVALREGEDLVIDSWLMSCRVFSRSAEQFIMNKLVEAARAQGLTGIRGQYVPSPKNEVVAGLYEKLGFTADGEIWRLDATRAAPLPHFINEEA